MERSIKRDLPIVRARLRRTCTVYELPFENILSAPLRAASMLGEIVTEHFGSLFDASKASRAIINRHPSCAPHLHMETMILPTIAAELSAMETPQ
jgi:hypothetical protein